MKWDEFRVILHNHVRDIPGKADRRPRVPDLRRRPGVSCGGHLFELAMRIGSYSTVPYVRARPLSSLIRSQGSEGNTVVT
jgi:hypothetical protein